MSGDPTVFAVVLCTRNRSTILRPTLDALAAQRERCFDVLVIDQSDVIDEEIAAKVSAQPGWRIMHDAGRGLARARNVGSRHTTAAWVVYLDDDVRPEPWWAGGIRDALARHPDVECVMVDTPAAHVPEGEYLAVSEFRIDHEHIVSGRRVRPWAIGFSLDQAFRRDVIARLGGYDERLGAGTDRFPASEDMDFNHRFLKAGGRALLTPAARAYHDQWRPVRELGPHYERYMRGWCGFAIKHLRGGDVVDGIWLWSLGLEDAVRMLLSSVRRRSTLRLRVAAYKFWGLARGTVIALRYPW